jgi:hypothetical protein
MSDSFESRFDPEIADDLPETLDEAALERISTVAYLLDECITIPGTNYSVGIDPLVGAVPVVGDALSTTVSLYIVAESAYLGVSLTTLLRMLANVTVDAVGGSIPYVGPVFDAVWKTNKWNFELLLEELSVDEDSSDDGSTDGETEVVEIEVEEA